MISTGDTGKKGEDLAVIYLKEQGYNILHRNWRYRHWEIDIIAEKDNVLYFFEVKTRTSHVFGFPEQNITRKKMQYLMNAASEYLYKNPQWQRVQYNALSILIQNEKKEYFLIEDIFL